MSRAAAALAVWLAVSACAELTTLARELEVRRRELAARAALEHECTPLIMLMLEADERPTHCTPLVLFLVNGERR